MSDTTAREEIEYQVSVALDNAHCFLTRGYAANDPELREVVRTVIAEYDKQMEAHGLGLSWRLPPMIWLQMDEGEPWHLFGDLDTVAACGAAITTSRPHVEERMTPEHACPACVDHAKERGLRMT